MNKPTLKKFAALTAIDGKISKDVETFVLTRLSRRDLKQFLFYLKQEIEYKKVHIRTPSVASAQTQRQLRDLFRGQEVEVHFEVETSLGAGVQIEYRDGVLELNARQLIAKSLDQLRENT